MEKKRRKKGKRPPFTPQASPPGDHWLADGALAVGLICAAAGRAAFDAATQQLLERWHEGGAPGASADTGPNKQRKRKNPRDQCSRGSSTSGPLVPFTDQLKDPRVNK